MGITWEEAEMAAQNRSEWRRSVVQCIHLDVGWIEAVKKSQSDDEVQCYSGPTAHYSSFNDKLNSHPNPNPCPLVG